MKQAILIFYLLLSLSGLCQTNGYVLQNADGSNSLPSGSITNTQLAGSITYSKLSLTGAILNGDLAGSIAYSKLSLTGAILNADLAGSIAYSKLSLTGAILNADLAGSIAYSKLSLTGAILNADLAGSIAYSKLSLTGAILNGDLAGSIANAKLANSTISGVALGSNLGTLTFDTHITGTSYNGSAGVTIGVDATTTSTVSVLVARDGNANVYADNFVPSLNTTATGATTTTLTVDDKAIQQFTGSTTQTVKLPAVSTLTTGHTYEIDNLSSGLVTVTSSGSNTIVILAANTWATFTCISTSGTGTASWTYSYGGVTTASGKVLTVNNNITFTGTDGTTITLPATNATMARTDALQTFTGVQTLSSAPVLSTGTVTSVAALQTFPTNASTLVGRLATADIAATSGATSATTIFTPTYSGWYRVTVYLHITTTGTSPVAGPVTITYTEPDGSVAQSHTLLMASTTGTVVTTTVNNSTTTGTVVGSINIYAKTGVAIQYAIAVSGTFASGRYQAHVICESL